MSRNFVRLALGAAIIGGFYAIATAPKVNAAAGETALSRCVDSVVQACNKKSDAAVNPCIDSGISQCEKQHKAKFELPGRPQTPVTNYRGPAR